MIADQLLQLSLLMATSPHGVQNAVKGLCYQLRQHGIPSLLRSDWRPVRVRDRRYIHPLYTVPHHTLNLTWTLSSVSDRRTEVPADWLQCLVHIINRLNKVHTANNHSLLEHTCAESDSADCRMLLNIHSSGRLSMHGHIHCVPKKVTPKFKSL